MPFFAGAFFLAGFLLLLLVMLVLLLVVLTELLPLLLLLVLPPHTAISPRIHQPLPPRCKGGSWKPSPY